MFPLDDICEIFDTTHKTEEYYEQPNRGHLPKFAMDHQFPKASTPSIPKYDENIYYCWDIDCTISHVAILGIAITILLYTSNSIDSEYYRKQDKALLKSYILTTSQI